MNEDERVAFLTRCGAIHGDLTRIEGLLARLPAKVDAFDEALHRARWERPPRRRDLDDRLTRLEGAVARIERSDDRTGPASP